MAYSKLIYLFLVSFLVINVPSVLAGKEDDDEYRYWKKREDEARTVAEASYIVDPFTVTNSFNRAVDNAVGAKNITGRSLRPIYTGPCRATNPIDRCWRCRADWANDRQRLASCAKGFGRKAFGGGRRSEIYVVTDSRDDDMINPRYGTLRWGVIQAKPLWIVFAHDMVIRLQQELIMASHKTIDGRGANVHIAYGAGITIQFVTNIIIHGLNIHDLVPREGGIIRDSLSHMGIRTRSDGDAISVFGSSYIWLDHLSLRSCADGLIDVIMRSTAVTISNNHFSQHNDVMLLGASDQFDGDTIMQVTVAFNTFGRRLVQRMPRVRWGFAHVVNNDYRNWEMYAIGGSSHPTIVSQGNRFTAPNNPNAKEITKRDYAAENVWASWNWTSEGDLYRNGAFFRPSGVRTSRLVTRNFDRDDVFKAKPGSFVARLTRFSGALNCKVGAPC